MMTLRSTTLALGFAVISAATVAFGPTAALAADILIGSGSTAQTHRDIVRVICRQLIRAQKDTDCELFPIEGRDAAEPLAVLNEVRNGAIELGLVTSDWQFHAVKASGPAAFMDVKFDNIRALFSLHSEPFTLVARRDSGITSLDDLEGKRVNIGNPGSGHRAVMDLLMRAKGWNADHFQLVEELNVSEQSLALCHNRVQAVVLTTAHPDPELAKALELCDAEIVEVTGADVEKFVTENPYFAVTEVPAGVYAGQPGPVKTFGVVVTAVSSEDIDEETIHEVTKGVVNSLGEMRRRHPALGALTTSGMMKDGLSAPLHPGALRFYQERGMM